MHIKQQPFVVVDLVWSRPNKINYLGMVHVAPTTKYFKAATVTCACIAWVVRHTPQQIANQWQSNKPRITRNTKNLCTFCLEKYTKKCWRPQSVSEDFRFEGGLVSGWIVKHSTLLTYSRPKVADMRFWLQWIDFIFCSALKESSYSRTMLGTLSSWVALKNLVSNRFNTWL